MGFIFSVAAPEQLQDKVFVVDGKLNTLSGREELKACIEAFGATLTETLNEETTCLITNTSGSGSAKNKKAEALGVKKLTEAESNTLIGRNQESKGALQNRARKNKSISWPERVG